MSGLGHGSVSTPTRITRERLQPQAIFFLEPHTTFAVATAGTGAVTAELVLARALSASVSGTGTVAAYLSVVGDPTLARRRTLRAIRRRQGGSW